jgi:hypothetical protein
MASDPQGFEAFFYVRPAGRTPISLHATTAARMRVSVFTGSISYPLTYRGHHIGA